MCSSGVWPVQLQPAGLLCMALWRARGGCS